MPDQVFWIDYDQRKPEIGLGFNSQTGVFPGTAVKFADVKTDQVGPGQTGTASALIITDHQQLMDSLDVGVSVSARYGLASGSLKVQFSQKTDYNQSSTFVLASFQVLNAVTRGHDVSIPDGSPAKQLIEANRMDDFGNSFGDYFVRGMNTGGEFYAVIRITSLSQDRETSLAASLHGAINGGIAAAEFSADMKAASSAKEEHTETSVTYYQASGLGAEIGATLKPEDVMLRLGNFPAAVATHPVPTSVELASYNTIPISMEPLEEIQDLDIALADAQAKRLEYLADKNNLEFAMANPLYFDELPSHDEVQHLAGEYTVAVNAVMAHLTKLAKGQISPAQMFDPSILTLPELPVLKRRAWTPPPPGTVKLPDFSKIPGGGGGPGPFEHIRQFNSQLVAAENEVESLGLHYNLLNVSGTEAVLLPMTGSVTAQTPPPGTEVPVGSTVTLQV